MRVLVTGASGTLGRAVVRAATDAGLEVRAASQKLRPAGDTEVRWSQVELTTGAGLDQALAGVDAIVHAATDPRRSSAVDEEGTRTLVRSAGSAGVRHLLLPSIVGIDDIPLPYYRSKLEAERVVEAGGVPWSILRATQFHSLVETFILRWARIPAIVPVPWGFRFQSVDEEEVAGRIVRSLREGPGGRLADFSGPEVLTLRQAALIRGRVFGSRWIVVPVPVRGPAAAAFRSGLNTTRVGERGIVRFESWLRRRSAT